jgi:hypothetical protein
MNSFRSSTVMQQLQGADGSVDTVIVQLNVVPVHPQDDFTMVAGALRRTVNDYPVTIDPKEMAGILRGIADGLEAQP